MPRVLEHIDKVARDKQRDVLFVVFGESKTKSNVDFFRYDYDNDPKRIKFISWLEENSIPYQECGPIASENGWESYRGQLYIDVPMDEDDERYLKLNNYLEHPDGKRKIDSIGYYHLPLKLAMKNAHHDEPGFWEKWAENF